MRHRLTALSILLLSAGCNIPGIPVAETPHTLPVSSYHPTPARHNGGSITFSDWQFPTNLSPVFNSEISSRQVQVMIFAGLQYPDPHLAWIPDLVEDVPTPENGLVRVDGGTGQMTVTYNLRSGLRWSDNQPLTSADVEYTWQVIVGSDPAQVVRLDGYDQISSFEIRDDRHFTIHFKRIYPAYLDLFQGNVLPRHALAATPVKELPRHPFWTRPTAASGPFKVDEVVADDHLSLGRNPAYGSAQGRHPAHLDKVVYQVFPDKESMVAALDERKVNVAADLYERDLDLALHSSEHLLTAALQEYEHITFNMADPNPVTGRPPLWKDDPRLLQALRLGLDLPGIVAANSRGMATLAADPFPATPWLNSVRSGPGADLAQARRLLDQDGWVVGSDGIRSRGGRRLEFGFTTYTGNPVRLRVQSALVSGWRELGVLARIENQPAADFLGDWQSNGTVAHGTYEAGMWIWVDRPDPDSVYDLFHSSRIPTDAGGGVGSNFGRTHDSRLDQALDQGRNTLQLDRRAEAYARAATAYREYGAEIPLYHRMGLVLTDEHLHNLVPHPDAWSANTWNAADWWVD